MDTKGKFAVALAIIIMVAWPIIDQKLYPPPPKPPAPPPGSPAAAGATPAPGATPAAGSTAAAPAQPAAPVTEPQLPEETKQFKTSAVDYTFTNHGGGIARAILTKHLLDQDSKGKDVVLNEYGPMPVGAISELSGQEGATASYTSTQDGQGAISYQRTTPSLQITKKFTLPTATDGPDQYIATLDLGITNIGAAPYLSRGYYIYLGSAAPIHEHDQARYIGLDWYRAGKATQINVMWFSAGKIPFLGIQTSPEKPQYDITSDSIGWAGVSSQYFTSIVTPVGTPGARIWATRFPLDIPTRQVGDEWVKNHPDTVPTWYAIDGAIGMPGFDIDPGKTYSQQFKIYIGPRQYQILKKMGEGQAEILHLGWFGFVSKFLLNMMNLMVSKTGCSYAVAIIVLTIVIKLLLWPMQNKATQSMKKMQALSPKMTELRDKYKDDPARMNQETMKLYKAYGVNPLAGCLPMFIQLPIFVGFYTMLGAAIELRNSQFFWVHDLSQPDTVAHFLGFAINILPLCMAATSVWMMSITPKSGDSAQQKMMMFMPLIFLFICYSYASGLALYMMVSNLFSVAQLYLTRNQTAPTLEKIAVPGKKRR